MMQRKHKLLTAMAAITAAALVTGSAQAGFVLVFDDPDTPQEEFRIVDEGQNDTGAGVGNLQYNGNFGGEEFFVGVTALSKDWDGTRLPLGLGFPEDAEFTININLFTSQSGRSMTVRLTDTGYNSSYEQADAYINTALGTPFSPDGAESIQFTFYGDTSNAEFGNSFVIGSSDVIPSPDDQNLIEVSGPAQPVGSLTMETTFIGNGTAEGRFTQVIALVPGGAAEPQPPTITLQPESVSADVGDTVEFTTAAAGTPPFTYNWLYNGAVLPGETASTLTLPNVQLAQAGDYQVLVFNAAGSDTSSRATLTVTEPGQGQPPTLTLQPESQQATAGDTVSFTVTATGTPPLAYRWQYNGVDLPGETSSILTLEQVDSDQTGSYQALVSNTHGSEPSELAALIVIDSGSPTITDEPDSLTVDVGDTAVFTVAATGTDPLSYQWYRDGAALPGQTTATLTLQNVQTAQAGAYRVLVSNSVGVELSSNATLTVNEVGAQPPTITSQPASQTVNEGDSAVFIVEATGTAPLSYQWYQDGVELPGATAATNTLENVQGAQAGSYVVSVSNSGGSELSSAATLTVGTQPTVIVEGNTVTRIENLSVPDQWERITVYDVDFLYTNAFAVYGAELDYDLHDENAGLGILAVTDVLNATVPIPERAGPAMSPRFHVGSFTEEIFVSAIGADRFLDAWNYCDQGCAGPGITTILPDEVTTWAKFTLPATANDPPTLEIVLSAPDQITITWSPDPAGSFLQQTTDINSGVWIPVEDAVSPPVIIFLSGNEPGAFYRVAVAAP